MNEKRIRRLMRLMGLMPIYQKPNTSKAAKGHKIYPICCGVCGWTAQPGLVRRHHLSADAAGLPLSGRHHGLAHPQGSVLAHLKHSGGGLLRRCTERSDPQVRPARDHEHGPGQPVHVVCLDGPACGDPACASRWMARAASSTTSSSNGSGGSLKYECVYLHAWETGSEAKAGVRKWMEFYNQSARIPPLAANHQPWSTGCEMKQLQSRISRSKE